MLPTSEIQLDSVLPSLPMLASKVPRNELAAGQGPARPAPSTGAAGTPPVLAHAVQQHVQQDSVLAALPKRPLVGDLYDQQLPASKAAAAGELPSSGPVRGVSSVPKARSSLAASRPGSAGRSAGGRRGISASTLSHSLPALAAPPARGEVFLVPPLATGVTQLRRTQSLARVELQPPSGSGAAAPVAAWQDGPSAKVGKGEGVGVCAHV